MGFIASLLGIIGFGIGVPTGLLLGFLMFIYVHPKNEAIKDTVGKPILELDSSSLIDLIPELPLWVMKPDYERVDWLNKFVYHLWPYFDKVVCGIIKSTMKPYFAEYIGRFQIKSIEFEILTLGTLPPLIEGVKVYESNENQLVSELALRWAGNPNIVLTVKLLAAQVTAQLIDVHISAATRITLRPFVPTFPCFSTVVMSLMNKPEVDFGLKVMGGDIMSIPGLHHFIQGKISKELARLYLWPRTLEIPILDSSQRSEEACGNLATSVKMKNLNPEWNEEFKLPVKDPHSQILELHVFGWDKVWLVSKR